MLIGVHELINNRAEFVHVFSPPIFAISVLPAFVSPAKQEYFYIHFRAIVLLSIGPQCEEHGAIRHGFALIRETNSSPILEETTAHQLQERISHRFAKLGAPLFFY